VGSDLLTRFNGRPAEAARAELLGCCSSSAWADRMTSGRPYSSAQEAVRQSNAILADLTVNDLAEALAGHPRIGEQPASAHDAARLNQLSRHDDWSRREQSGVLAADAETSRALAESNLEYERRFGHIYLVCASGRTGEQLLALLRSRLHNDASTEWQVVRAELQKINEIRLRSLLAGPA
jgi:2-oxo-4-hydroxy-4-carboxy-5-ureidoimidazoline decarboxylase